VKSFTASRFFSGERNTVAATNYPGVTYSEANDVRHMVDFVRAHPHTFNPRWTLARARAEEQNWHGGGPGRDRSGRAYRRAARYSD
jgi:hypothetical protein